MVTLDDIRKESDETLTSFYGQFHKIFNEIYQHIEIGEICRTFSKSLELLKKASKKLRNNYHIKNINILEELAIIAKGYINWEREKTMVANLPSLA